MPPQIGVSAIFMDKLGVGAVFIILPASLTNTMSAWVLAKRLRLLADVRDMMTIPSDGNCTAVTARRFRARAVGR